MTSNNMSLEWLEAKKLSLYTKALKCFPGSREQIGYRLQLDEILDRINKLKNKTNECTWRDGPSSIELKSVDLVTVDIKIL